MIQATELMLGDYVRVEVDDNEFDIDYICDIGYVPEWNDLGVITCHNGNEWLREAEIYPVPLTKEILDKNFTLNKPYQSQYGTKSLVYYALPSPIYLSGIWNLVWVIGENENYLVIEDDPLIRMKYVHQLQHALKLCNIQKEIQL